MRVRREKRGDGERDGEEGESRLHALQAECSVLTTLNDLSQNQEAD